MHHNLKHLKEKKPQAKIPVVNLIKNLINRAYSCLLKAMA
jgi:hypothetical protein